MTLFYQIHGYKKGHQLLFTNLDLSRIDQDTVDRLSDISGSLRPGEEFYPYLTCYPLPSKQFFVIARTWQDFSVQRAGCVVTKSLIIPILEWEASNDINSLFQILLNASPSKEEILDISLHDNPIMPPVIKTAVDELVEALFLENRQPIVMFNCSESDIITTRLYNVFWTSIRRNFSVCTFALSQRSLSGKPFDLLFAPSSVKSKFTEWPGRRIDAMGKPNKVPRHRWTSELSSRIFSSTSPTLFDRESKSFFSFNNNSDESTFRLSLLWKELLTKAESEVSPMAILGLLDIINSQPLFTIELYKKLQPYIYNAIHHASKKLSVEDAWKFYTALLAKHKKKLMERHMLSAVRESSAALTYSNPSAAINFYASYSQPFPSILCAGLGDGLAESFEQKFQYELLTRVTSQLGVILLATSKPFCRNTVEIIDKEPQLMKNFFAEALTSGPIKDLSKAQKNLSYYIVSEKHVLLLSILLQNCNSQTFKNITTNIGKNTGFKIRAFDNILLKHAIKFRLLEYLKDSVVLFDKEGASDPLLTSIIKSEPQFLRWLVLQTDFDENRKYQIIVAVFRGATDKTLNMISEDYSLVLSIMNTLFSQDNTQDVDIIATIVAKADIPVDEALSKLNKLPSSAIQNVKEITITNFLIRAFSKVSDKNGKFVIELLNKATQANAKAILDYVTSSRSDNDYILKHIYSLLVAGPHVKRVLLQNIEHVSRLLAISSPGNMESNLVSAWISLLVDAYRNREMQARSAAVMLDYSYTWKKFDPSDLIVSSFPIVYKTFLKGSVINQIFPFTFFSDWDKCRTLREDLVYRYLHSNWSRLGLFRVAIETDIVKEIASILNSQKGGEKFINQAFHEAKILNLNDKDPILQALSIAFKSPHN